MFLAFVDYTGFDSDGANGSREVRRDSTYNRLEALIVTCRKDNARAGRLIGQFVVSDPAICHAQPTFRGTRILVADVLEQVAAGTAWETIVEEWRGNVSAEAIAEAVRLASQAFRDHSAQYAAPEYVPERAPA